MTKSNHSFEQPEVHAPRFAFDCENCKYNWCCGYACACVYESGHRKLPDPPDRIKILVNKTMQEEELEWIKFPEVTEDVV